MCVTGWLHSVDCDFRHDHPLRSTVQRRQQLQKSSASLRTDSHQALALSRDRAVYLITYLLAKQNVLRLFSVLLRFCSWKHAAWSGYGRGEGGVTKKRNFWGKGVGFKGRKGILGGVAASYRYATVRSL